MKKMSVLFIGHGNPMNVLNKKNPLNRNFGESADLAVPTPDHIEFFNDNLIAGSLSMTSLLIR